MLVTWSNGHPPPMPDRYENYEVVKITLQSESKFS